MGPVLLFDMSVVVLLIGPAPGEADLAGRAAAADMMVDGLAAIVGIDVTDSDGQNLAHLVEGLDRPAQTIAFPDGRQPQLQCGIQPGRPRIAGFLPDVLNDPQHFTAIKLRPLPGCPGAGLPARLAQVYPRDGILADEPKSCTDLVQYPSLRSLVSLAITL